MKQTAVEYIDEVIIDLIEGLKEMEGDKRFRIAQLTLKAFKEQTINKAKDMEREQIIEAYKYGLVEENIEYIYDVQTSAEEYYNETYKNGNK